MSVVLDLSYILSIWISAAVTIIYTLLGGLYSVAYTDIIQLGLIFISLVSLLYCSCYRVLGFLTSENTRHQCVYLSFTFMLVPTVGLCSLCSDEPFLSGH